MQQSPKIVLEAIKIMMYSFVVSISQWILYVRKKLYIGIFEFRDQKGKVSVKKNVRLDARAKKTM